MEEVAKAVGGGYRRLQMPLKLALGVRGTVAGHRLGALEGEGGEYPPSPPFRCIPAPTPLLLVASAPLLHRTLPLSLHERSSAMDCGVSTRSHTVPLVPPPAGPRRTRTPSSAGYDNRNSSNPYLFGSIVQGEKCFQAEILDRGLGQLANWSISKTSFAADLKTAEHTAKVSRVGPVACAPTPSRSLEPSQRNVLLFVAPLVRPPRWKQQMHLSGRPVSHPELSRNELRPASESVGPGSASEHVRSAARAVSVLHGMALAHPMQAALPASSHRATPPQYHRRW